MKQRIQQCRLFLIALFAFLCFVIVGITVVPFGNKRASATEEILYDTMMIKETQTNNLAYQPLERINYVNTSACRVLNPETERFAGIMGQNAVRKTPNSKSKAYQLYFDYCFEAGKTYEISFYAKTVGAGGSFYVKTWYASDQNITIKDDLPNLQTVNGEWTKYSFTFTSNEHLYELFKLTIEPKNTFEEIYYDQFSAVEVDDGYAPTICGEKFTDSDWSTGVDSGEIVGFTEENYPAALKMTTGTLTSKFFEIPADGIYRLRFALQRTAGTSVTFSLKNAVGNVLEQAALTNESLLSYYDIVTPDVSAEDYVYLQFDVECAGEEDYAVIGMLEMHSHTHDESKIVSTPDSPCVRLLTCGVCDFVFEISNHDFVEEKGATCVEAGKKVCQHAECGVEVTLPATGEHVYKDAQGNDVLCSAENYNKAYQCAECGGGRTYFNGTHTLRYVSVSSTEHKAVCTTCVYEEETTNTHSLSTFVIAIIPTEVDNGYAVVTCADCEDDYGVFLPCIEENTTLWTMSVVKEETCLETGKIRYTLNENSGVYIEYETEALGHDYEAVKKQPTCTEEGVSLHHKCIDCGYVKESETEITTLEAYGHELMAWVVETEPTLTSNGLRKRYCSRCEQLVEEEEIPKLDETNYTKYALEEHDAKKGFYYYYESAEYGTYSVYVEPVNEDNVTVIVICVSCGVVIAGSVAAYCILAIKAGKTKKKKE